MPPPEPPTGSPVVPLPTPAELRDLVEHMVGLGPRLTGTSAHDRFCTWLEDELAACGLDVLPADRYPYDRWLAERVALEVVEGDRVEPVDVAAAYVRAASTPPDGVTGPLVDLGPMPVPDPFAAVASGTEGPGVTPEVRAWADALPRDELRGAVAVVDLAVPPPLTAEVFVALASYLHWPGHTDEDWARIDYRRPWMGPWPELGLFAGLGVAGVVFVVDACRELLTGNYSPHVGRPQPVPAVVVDRDTGRALHERAVRRPEAHLVLHAPTQPVEVRSVTAVLHGASDEVVVVNSHSDGQNGFEENGSVALVALARHFASLPPGERLHRTLVLASWPGHMSGVVSLEDAACWITAHPDLCDRAVAAVTVEHLGATEWVETPGLGYHPTGEPEVTGIWTTQGLTAELARSALVEADLARHALLRPPVQITPGAPFHEHGVPHVSGIAGPTYLLVVSEDGELAKFDEHLAARQLGFYADVVRRLDGADRDELRSGDPTLGAGPPR